MAQGQEDKAFSRFPSPASNQLHKSLPSDYSSPVPLLCLFTDLRENLLFSKRENRRQVSSNRNESQLVSENTRFSKAFWGKKKNWASETMNCLCSSKAFWEKKNLEPETMNCLSSYNSERQRQLELHHCSKDADETRLPKLPSQLLRMTGLPPQETTSQQQETDTRKRGKGRHQRL